VQCRGLRNQLGCSGESSLMLASCAHLHHSASCLCPLMSLPLRPVR
jgi:hypothetical protein